MKDFFAQERVLAAGHRPAAQCADRHVSSALMGGQRRPLSDLVSTITAPIRGG